jgi:hypothetical protein
MIMDIALWLIIASVVVAAIMNPGGFTKDIASIGDVTVKETSVLTAKGYNS